MRYLILFLTLTGCATQSLPDRTDSSIHTVSVLSGTHGELFYDDELKDESQKACPYGYAILEKTKKPTTLDESVVSKYRYYWVIKCK